MPDTRYPFLTPWRLARVPSQHERYMRDTFPGVERVTGCKVSIDLRDATKPWVWVHRGELGVTEHIDWLDRFCMWDNGHQFHPPQSRIIEAVNAFKMKAREKDALLEKQKRERDDREGAEKARKEADIFAAYSDDVEKLAKNRVTSTSVGKASVLGAAR